MPKQIFILFFASTLWFASCQKEITKDDEYETLGTAAKDLLTASPYSSLVVEINYMPGYEPDVATLNNISQFLTTYLNKPGGITVRKHAIAESGKTILTLDDIVRLERTHRKAYTYGNAITVHVLITDSYFTSSLVLATSYWNTSICLFGKAIAENSNRPGQLNLQQLYTTVILHEFGHLLGLVDQGSPMQQQHRDKNHGAHCNNKSCLMYHAIETAGNSISTIPVLDAACRADLKANGGK